MKFNIYYRRSGCITIEAETQEDARYEFDETPEYILDENGSFYEIDEIEEEEG